MYCPCTFCHSTNSTILSISRPVPSLHSHPRSFPFTPSFIRNPFSSTNTYISIVQKKRTSNVATSHPKTDPFSIILGTMTLVEVASTANKIIQKIKKYSKGVQRSWGNPPNREENAEARAFYSSTMDVDLRTEILPITECCQENVGDLKAILKRWPATARTEQTAIRVTSLSKNTVPLC